MGKTLEVRIASTADLEALMRLATAFRDHHGLAEPSEADFRTSIVRLLQNGETEFLLACGAGGGTSLGYVQARYRYSAWTSALEAEIEDVFVVHAARRRGIGRQLMVFAMARAVAKGCRTIGLNTNERNAGAVALYQQLGFCAERARWHGGRQLWLTKVLTTTAESGVCAAPGQQQ
jgi:ribosomal protein S18 acetylase RimI-like enzyme